MINQRVKTFSMLKHQHLFLSHETVIYAFLNCLLLDIAICIRSRAEENEVWSVMMMMY